MAKLDRSKPYGIISGTGDAGCYEQDGSTFDANGDEVGASETTTAKVARTAKPGKAAPATDVDAQIAAAGASE